MGAAFGALMLSFLIALFLFSNASSRKRPVFFLSAAAVTLGAVEGFMITHFHNRVGLSRAVAILVLLLPVLIFIARIFNILVAIIQIATRPWNFVADWNQFAISKIEWILQLIFNVCVWIKIINVVQIALILHGRQGKTEDQWFQRMLAYDGLNGYLTIIGVVFATVWANWYHT
ncbi:hypothetical protein R3P38DRAFT_2809876 [Favolaschia claudopus]|uniref:Uncharacterized protein n=1 Tax=Favolaschia claudopus TaxID=2862362 RepID=A0AAV9ZD76_9AGAR